MARYNSGVRYDSGARYNEPEPTATPKTMSQNLISETMSDAARDAVLADVNAAIVKLEGVKTPLTAEQRRKLARLADAEIGLLQTALTFAQQNPGALPGDFDVAEFAKDVALATQIAPIRARIALLNELVMDTTLAIFSDAYVAALEIYKLAKTLNRGAAFEAFIDDFGRRFARGSYRKTTPPTA